MPGFLLPVVRSRFHVELHAGTAELLMRARARPPGLQGLGQT